MEKCVKVANYWVTAIQYMTKSKKLVAACADRTIKFYDLTQTNVNTPVSTITELDGVPLCLDYCLTQNEESGVEERLLMGDNLGICHLYTFKEGWHSCCWKINSKIKKEDESGLQCDHKEQISSNIDKAIEEEMSKRNDNKNPWKSKRLTKPISKQYMVNIHVVEKQIHREWITKIKYVPELKYIFSSSLDGFIHLHEIESLAYKSNGTFNLHQKPINAFVYSVEHRYVASCGEERHIIMWDPLIRRAITYLYGHNTSV